MSFDWNRLLRELLLKNHQKLLKGKYVRPVNKRDSPRARNCRTAASQTWSSWLKIVWETTRNIVIADDIDAKRPHLSKIGSPQPSHRANFVLPVMSLNMKRFQFSHILFPGEIDYTKPGKTRWSYLWTLKHHLVSCSTRFFKASLPGSATESTATSAWQK